MDKKVTGIVAYITILGWFVAFLAGDKEGAKFHLNQALVVDLSMIVVGVLGAIPIVRIFAGILGLIVLILWGLGIYYAVNDKDNEIPVLGIIKLLK